MFTFPVTSSTLSSSALGHFINENYTLGGNCKCSLLKTGINHTYLIESQLVKYILRVYSYNWRTSEEIQAELDLLQQLKDNAVGVSYPVKDKGGNYIQEINAPEGKRYAVLFTFAKGKKVRFMSPEACEAVGRQMAKFHNYTLSKQINRVTYNAYTLLDLSYKLAATFFSEDLPEMKFIKSTGEELKEVFKSAATLPEGVIHLDIWYDNMAVTDSNDMTLFDFDFCGNGWFIMDISYFCTQLFFIETDKTIYESKLQSFLKGYNNCRLLSKEELDLIPHAGTIIWFFYLGIQVQRFDWSNVFLSENYLKMFIGRIPLWQEYYKEHKITISI